MVSFVTANDCFTTTFPRILGGALNESSFHSMDIDSNDNIIVGGKSKDQDLLIVNSNDNEAFLLFI